MGSDAAQDLPVRLRDRLRHDPRNAEVDENGRRQNARLDLRPDSDYRHLEVARPQLPHRLDVRRVGLDDVRQLLGVALHELRVRVDPEHLVAVLHEVLGERAAEPAQPHDEELLVPSQ
jgi:hypothetical protein